MTLLYGVLPPVMAWQLRAKVQAKRQQQVAPPQPPQPQPQSPASAAEAAVERLQQQWPPAGPAEPAPGAGRRPELPWWRQQHDEMVPGGAPVLAGLFVAAVAVIQQRILADTGLSSAAAGEASGYVQVGLLGSLACAGVAAARPGVAPLRWQPAALPCMPHCCAYTFTPPGSPPPPLQGFIEAALHSPGGVPEAVLALLQGAAPL